MITLIKNQIIPCNSKNCGYLIPINPLDLSGHRLNLDENICVIKGGTFVTPYLKI